MGCRLSCKGRPHHRDPLRAYLPGNAPRLHPDRAYGSVPLLRSLPRDHPHDDGAVFEVHEDGDRNDLEAALRLTQLYRDVDLDTPGAQRVLASKPVIYWRCLESEGVSREGILATRCELFPVNGVALFEGEELCEFDGWKQATVAGVVDA